MIKEETREFDGVLYSRTLFSDEPVHWSPDSAVDFNHPIRCNCGGVHFTIRYSNNYEMSATCVSCGADAVVYTG